MWLHKNEVWSNELVVGHVHTGGRIIAIHMKAE